MPKGAGGLKKRVSTKGYQTQRPDAEFCVWCFWNCPPPLGVFQVPRRKLIDVDKFGVTLEKCNRMGGWAIKVLHVHKDGHYHHGAKITVIFAIEPGDPRLAPHARGNVQRPRRWIRCVRNIGTTTNIFRDFFDYVCRDIETNNIPITDLHRILSGITLLHITAGTYTTRLQTVSVLAIFLSYHGRHTIQSTVP